MTRESAAKQRLRGRVKGSERPCTSGASALSVQPTRSSANPKRGRARLLTEAHAAALRHFGPLEWWPGDGDFEIALGAILTQNTAWTNVEKAIARLAEDDLLTPAALGALDDAAIAERIRPSGYFNQKTRTLRAFLAWLEDRPGATVREKLSGPLDEIRASLLGVRGIGPETADSILLYAAGHPTFVVDAYTRRILSRHGLIDDAIDYEDLRRWFEESLPPDPVLYNELHAQIVMVGKDFCHKREPSCGGCPFAVLPFE